MSQSIGVLLMAYGTPRNLEEVEPFFRSILGARSPSPGAVQELVDRYRSVGGRSPLLEITHDVATALERRLNGRGGPSFKVYVGMKHWHPFIAETVPRMAGDGAERLIALPLAPHYSQMSIEGYRGFVEDAVRSLPQPLPVRFIESWHANPLFVTAVARKVREALREGFPSGDVEVVFTAHSLPRSIQQWGDPYPQELRQSCEAVAKAAGVASWQFAYQSASHTGRPWLGPDILETVAALAGQGGEQVLVVPIGFVSDNLEILFDIDVEAQELARGLDIRLRRTQMLNASPTFVEALADVVVNGTGARDSKYASAAPSSEATNGLR